MKEESLELISKFAEILNNDSRFININQINKVKKTGVSDTYAFRLLINEYIGMNELLNKYYDDIIIKDNSDIYLNNDYYKNVKFKNKKIGNWEIKYEKYHPYELFVRDDIINIDGYEIPRFGYFDKPFYYPCVMENNNIWMSITPNEINTMKNNIENAYGNVLTFGLGLGYFSYMVSNKENVKSVTIVEKDKKVIELFKNNILPFYKFKYKINIIEDDCYRYYKNIKDGDYDYIFVDIYHDVSDGIDCFKRVNNINNFNKTIVEFWIYESMKYYL